MKPEELKGRELAAWLYGYVWGNEESEVAVVLAAAEIERLCAGQYPLSPLLATKIDAAARDAAALDEIAQLFIQEKAWSQTKGAHMVRSYDVDKLEKILERTGRKIGGGT